MTCIPPSRVHAEHAAAPAVEVAVDLAHVRLGDADLDDHDRLEERRLRLVDAVLERHRGRDLERQLVRVDRVERAVVQRRLEVGQRDSRRRRPRRPPRGCPSRRPGRSPSGTEPPTIFSANSTPPSGFGSSSSQTSPNMPWPPVCFLYRPWTLVVPRIVSLYGTLGTCVAIGAPNLRLSRSRITAVWASPIVRRTCSPVALRSRRTVGSSSSIRASAGPILSRSCFETRLDRHDAATAAGSRSAAGAAACPWRRACRRSRSPSASRPRRSRRPSARRSAPAPCRGAGAAGRCARPRRASCSRRAPASGASPTARAGTSAARRTGRRSS